jgi:hypothetical protein
MRAPAVPRCRHSPQCYTNATRSSACAQVAPATSRWPARQASSQPHSSPERGAACGCAVWVPLDLVSSDRLLPRASPGCVRSLFPLLPGLRRYLFRPSPRPPRTRSTFCANYFSPTDPCGACWLQRT